jgi:hypothetical protein
MFLVRAFGSGSGYGVANLAPLVVTLTGYTPGGAQLKAGSSFTISAARSPFAASTITASATNVGATLSLTKNSDGLWTVVGLAVGSSIVTITQPGGNGFSADAVSFGVIVSN